MIIINTSAGKLRSKKLSEHYAFLGIPYAKPPVGELRWKKPEPLEPWEGIKDAFEFGAPACQAKSQVPPGGDPADPGILDGGSEDCLYLNIWTPHVNPEKKLPVFVWIHGGAFCSGSGAGRNARPEPFVRRGIIFVTFNYRLGIMGYFAHPELSMESKHGVSGNYAHFDQLAALRWVKQNIEAFGGDPDNITIGGCSAGAGSTQVMCNSPLARGLFKRAIIESSIGIASALYPEDDKLSMLADFEARGVEYMKMLGCKNIKEMRALPYQALIAPEESKFRRKYHYGTTMGINEDGYLLPKHYMYSNERLKNADIPYIVGNTADEGGEHIMRLGKAVFEEQSRAVFGDKTDEYLALCNIKDDADAAKAAHDTHLRFASAKVFAEMSAAAGRAPVYIYSFARKDPQRKAAYHGTDTKYLLGNYKAIPGVTEEDDAVANAMQEYWCNFIKTGNPNNPQADRGLPEWPPYTSQNRKVLFIGYPVRVISDDVSENPLMKYTRELLAGKLIKSK